MRAPGLRAALAAIRQLSPPVATTELASGDSPATPESQAAQGIDDGVATVATVSTHKSSTPHFPPVAPTCTRAAPVTLFSVATGGDGGDSQQRRGIALSPPVESAVATVATTPSWIEDRAWCARIGAAGLVPARRKVVHEWIIAAGGWHDASAIHIPTSLPRNLALATLKTHARALGLAVRDVDQEVERLFAAGERAANPDLASDPAELMLQPGGQS